MTSQTSVLYLVRHAVAEDRHRLGDEARPLTAEGREAFRAHLRSVRTRLRIEGIATSPLVRAVQTAEMIAEAVGVAQVRVLRELCPEGKAGKRIPELARGLGGGWALVGHNPSLAEAAALALDVEELPFNFKKGAILALTLRGKLFQFDFYSKVGKPVLASLKTA